MQDVTSADFEAQVLQSEIPVLVDFWAPWCGPCKALSPSVAKIAAETEGKLKVVKCNIDQSQDIASRYSIMSIPTLMLFSKGEVVEQLVGLVKPDKIMEKVKRYI
ncbi:MAG: thioredoxin [Candidatus Cloacimonetes bacterium]|nr:thioredoxin [Candidatus Cloacimonadota bacterium]NLO11349.1 thioredoxin [Candidatus Cloacimonadota bacterium]